MAWRRAAVAAAALILLTSLVLALSRRRAPEAGHAAKSPQSVAMGFEPNVGQSDARVRFVAHRPATKVFLTDEGVELTYETFNAQTGTALRITPRGETASSRALVAATPLPGRSNYLLGPDRTAWRMGVQSFARVTRRGVYPGIDLAYSGTGAVFQMEFALGGNADISTVRLGIDGARSLRIDQHGRLVIDGEAGPLVFPSPSTPTPGVSVQYVLNGPDEVGLSLGPGGRERPSSVSVPVAFGGTLDGLGFEEANGVAVGRDDAEYVTGRARLGTLPAQPGTFDPLQNHESSDVVVAKYAPSGDRVFTTFVGGSLTDQGQSIAVDERGNAYVAGWTRSNDIPATSGAFQTTFNGGEEDAFALELGPNGADLVYLTYLGGAAKERAWAVAVDRSGAAHVAGHTYSTDFPTTAVAVDRTSNGDLDGFVTKLNPTGTALAYSTFLGGRETDAVWDLAVDETGAAYVTGLAGPDFPVTPGAYKTAAAMGGGFVTKLEPSGAALVYSTFLGGSEAFGRAIAVDASGAAYVTGDVTSADLPVTPGAFDKSAGGLSDGFVAKLAPSGSTLVYASYIGGNNSDIGLAVAVDEAGSAHVAASVLSGNITVTSGPLVTLENPQWVWVAKLDPAGTLVFSTAIGGSSSNYPQGIAIDRRGTAHIVGKTNSPEFRSASVPADGTVQQRPTYDGFLARLPA